MISDLCGCPETPYAYVLKPDTAGGTPCDQPLRSSGRVCALGRGPERGPSGRTVRSMTARRRVRGNIERLPSGSYRAIVYAGVDALTGREHRLKETWATLADAKLALTRLQRQVDEQKHPKSGITVREAIQQWLDVAELGVTTREQYDDLVRLYIDPTLGNMQAGKLDAELLERFYSRLLRCKHLCSGRPPKRHSCVSQSGVRPGPVTGVA